MSEVKLPPRPPFEDAWRKRFEGFATQRDDDAGIAGWSASGLDSRFRRFSRAWQGSAAGKVWLDAGCGAGTYARFLASQGAEVVGLDYCHPATVKAKARDNWNCMWAVADVTRLPLRPGGFDGVLCFGVLQALADSAPVVRELALQAVDGGEVWIDVLNRYCVANVVEQLSRRLCGKATHLRYESPRRIRRLMHEAGLVKVRLHWVPLLPARFKRFQPFVESWIATALLRYLPGFGIVFCHSCLVVGLKQRHAIAPTDN